MGDRRGEALAWAVYVALFVVLAGAAVAVGSTSTALGLNALAFAVACSQLGVLGGVVVLTRAPGSIGDDGRAQVRLAEASAAVAAVAVLSVAADVPLGGLQSVALIAAVFIGVAALAATLLGLTEPPGDLALSAVALLLVAASTAGALTSSDGPSDLDAVLGTAVPFGLGTAAIGALVLFLFDYGVRAAASQARR